MKKMTKMLCVLLCGVLLCGAVAVAMPKEDKKTTAPPRQVPVEIVEGDSKTQVSMKLNEKIQLVVKEENQSKQQISDSGSGSGSGNPSDSESEWEIKTGGDVIELDGKTGVVSAKREGTAEVIKRVKGGVAACKITVENSYIVESLKLSGETQMRIGETQQLNYTILPTAAKDVTIKWESDRPEVLSVDETGKVTAHQSGSATITAKADSATDKLTISVRPGLTGIILKPQKMSLHIGESAGIEADPVPIDADLEGLTWSSSNKNVAYYKDGAIYAAGVGNAKIIASVGSVSAECEVHIFVDGNITIEPSRVTIKKGESKQLTANLTGDLRGKQITWRSSNAAVASVNNSGKVTAIKKGSAVITAEALGVKTTCQVTVTESGKQPNKQPSQPSSKPDNNKTGNASTNPITGAGSQFTYVPNTGSTYLYMPGSTVTITEFAYTMPKNIPEAVYLTVDSKLDDVAGSIADTLSANGMQATFFVSTENLYGSDDMLRHLTGDGNSIGLLLTPEQANSGNVVALLDQANRQLSVITGMPTRLVRVSGGTSGNISSETLNTLLNAGYRVWDWNTNANESGQAADASYRAVSKAIDTTGTPAVRFDGSVATDTVLRQLLPYMKYCGIPTKAIQASDNAVCSTAAG